MQNLGLGVEISGKDLGLGSMLSHLSMELQSFSQHMTTDFEAQMVAFNKQSLSLGANMGKTGGNLKQFESQASSMAYTLNGSVDEAGRAIRAFTNSGTELKDWGITSAATMAKVSSVTGVSADVFMEAAQAAKGLGLTDKDLKGFGGAIVEAGQQLGDMQEALGSMPALMKQMQEKSALAGKALKGQDLKNYATDVLAMAAALKQSKTITNPKEAMGFAQSLGESLIDAQRKMQGLFAGTETEMPQLASKLGVATGSIVDSFELLKKGPAEFMQGIKGMIDKSKAAGRYSAESANFLRAQVEAAVGKDQADMIMRYSENATDATQKTIDAVKNSTKSLGDLGDAYRTGLTYTQLYERQQVSLTQTFRNLGKTTQKEVLEATGKGLKDFGSLLQKTVSDGGPMGMFVERLASVNKVGIMASLPKAWRGNAAVLGTVFTQLAHPIDMVGAALAALMKWFNSLKKMGMTTKEAVTTIASDLKKSLGNAVDWIDKNVMTAVSDAIHGALNVLHSIDWPAALKSVLESIKSVFVGSDSDSLSGMLGDIDWSKELKDFWQTLGDLWTTLKPYLQEVQKNLVDFVENEIVPQLSAAWDGFVDYIKESSPTAKKWIEGISSAFDAVNKVIGYVKIGIESLITVFKATMTVLNPLLGSLSSAFDIYKGIRGLFGDDAPTGAATKPNDISPLTPVGPRPVRGNTVGDTTAQDASLEKHLEATNAPDWYTQDFKPLFQNVAKQLAGLLGDLPTQAQTPAASQNSRNVPTASNARSPHASKHSVAANGLPISGLPTKS